MLSEPAKTRKQSRGAATHRRYLQTAHAYAAVQSVLAPLCKLKTVQFPPRPETAQAARQLWRGWLQRLHHRNWFCTQDPGNYQRISRCPWGLFGLSEIGDATGGCRRRECPSCHGLQAALTVETVLRARDEHPGQTLRLILQRERVRYGQLKDYLDEMPTKPLDPDCPNQLPRYSVEMLDRRRCMVRRGVITLGGTIGSEIPPHPKGVARAVSWLMRYPAGNLLIDDPSGQCLEDLIVLTLGRKQPYARGAFRQAVPVVKLEQCRIKGAFVRRVESESHKLPKKAPLPVISLEGAVIVNRDEYHQRRHDYIDRMVRESLAQIPDLVEGSDAYAELYTDAYAGAEPGVEPIGNPWVIFSDDMEELINGWFEAYLDSRVTFDDHLFDCYFKTNYLEGWYQRCAPYLVWDSPRMLIEKDDEIPGGDFDEYYERKLAYIWSKVAELRRAYQATEEDVIATALKTLKPPTWATVKGSAAQVLNRQGINSPLS